MDYIITKTGLRGNHLQDHCMGVQCTLFHFINTTSYYPSMEMEVLSLLQSFINMLFPLITLKSAECKGQAGGSEH